jgi:hypothetical protein
LPKKFFGLFFKERAKELLIFLEYITPFLLELREQSKGVALKYASKEFLISEYEKLQYRIARAYEKAHDALMNGGGINIKLQGEHLNFLVSYFDDKDLSKKAIRIRMASLAKSIDAVTLESDINEKDFARLRVNTMLSAIYYLCSRKEFYLEDKELLVNKIDPSVLPESCFDKAPPRRLMRVDRELLVSSLLAMIGVTSLGRSALRKRLKDILESSSSGEYFRFVERMNSRGWTD